jgi:FKBP-type peptidyl-prolyl cis-trans isomerase
LAKRETKNRSKGSAGNNRKLGDEFMQKNRQKHDVIETESGLQYSIIEKCDRSVPVEESIVTIHQRALLLNGTLLEDTYRQNKPDEVKLSELIEGLQEGIQLMPKGSRFKFWVPAELAWGKKGTGNKIPPNSVLHFDIRLIDFY